MSAASLKDNRSLKHILINPRFQLSFLAYMLGLAALTLVVFYGAKIFFFAKFAKYLGSIGYPEDHFFFDFLRDQSRAMDTIFLVAAGVELVLLAVLGLWVSHRVAGPLYRLKQHMLGAARGEPPTELHFRDHDYFPELADAYNQQIRRWMEKGMGKTQ